MRSTLVSAALVVVVVPVLTATSGCRSFRATPSGGAVAATVGESARPSGLATRAVFRLPNGLSVVLEENHASPVVAFGAWVHAGAADDPAGHEGLAHLFQHLLLSSTKTRPPGQIQREVAAIGGRVSAFTTHDETVFQGVVAAPFVEPGLGLLADLLMHPALSASDIEAARRSAQNDLRQAAVFHERVAAQAVLATAFSSHPYGRPVLGTEGSLATLLPERVNAFFQTFYAPSNATLVVVGDFDPATVRALITSSFGTWVSATASTAPRPRPVPAVASRATASGTPRVAVFTADIAAPQVAVAFQVPGTKAAETPALELLAALLGARRAGRLELEVVRNRQLVTSPRAYLFSGRDGGLLIATATAGPGRPEEAARAIRDEILRLSREPVSAEELLRARALVEGDGAADKAGLSGYARKLGFSMSVAGDPTFETTYLERLRAIDPGQLLDVAARAIKPTEVVISVVLPAARDPQRDERAAKLLPRLRAVAASPLPSPSSPPATSADAVTPSGRDVVVDYRLPSGVRLLVLRDDTAPQLSVRAVWSGGVRFEDVRMSGATALLARLLPRATKTRGADLLAADLADMAGTLDGVAGLDSLALRGDFLSSHWERGLELVVDCLRNPKLADEDVERERRVLLDAIRSRDDDPTELALRLFQETLFGRHPYRHAPGGTSDSVAGLSRRRLLDFFRQRYLVRSLTLAVVGPVEPDRIAAKVQSLFGDAPPDRQPAPAPSPSAPPSAAARMEPTEAFQLIAKAQARLVIGYPGVSWRDPDRYALEVLAQILGGAGGRLTATPFREKGVITEQAGAVSQEGIDPGYFAVYAGVRPDTIDAVVPALRAELMGLAASGVTDDEVWRARRILVGTRALSLERRGAVAMAVALHGAFGAGGRSYRRDVDELAKVTAGDVARVARKILDPRREVLAVVRPRELDRPPRATIIRAVPSLISPQATKPPRATTTAVLPQQPARYTSR